MLKELFSAIDDRDAARFSAFLARDCRFIFGNHPEVSGADDIRAYVSGFFASIEALSHELEESWELPNGVVCHGRVSYTRKDGSTLTVPFANVLKTGAGGIEEYLIFADTSELYP